MTLPIILHIAVPTPLRSLFDYQLPEHISPDLLKPGMRLLVPWQRGETVGILVAMDRETTLPLEKIRPILSVLDSEPSLPSELMALGQWASDYYHHPLGDVLSHMLPGALRKKPKKEKTLTKPPSPLPVPTAKKQNPPTLSEEQKIAVEEICHHFSHFHPVVLEGVTGSGKTEVYLQCIANALAQNKQVLVLVPEIGLTPQTLQRFESRLQVPMVVMHSNLTEKTRLRHWQGAATGEARLVIGTRSAVFTPLPQLGLIIIDEAHDVSFKQQDSFRYSAHDLALMRAKQKNIPIVLGSATPSLETFLNIQKKKFHHLQLTERVGGAKPPVFELIDVRGEYLQGGLCASVIEAIQQHVKEKSQVLLFLNRRGFAPTLTCHECGWLAGCRHCDARLTLHLSPKKLMCHHCSSVYPLVSSCPQCHQASVQPLGLGTERVEETLAALFPEEKICRIDRDTTQKKGALHALLQQIHDGEHRLLLGTQMLAKGHHFPKVRLVVILNADHGFFSPDFRSSERTAQLLVQVAGRAGREDALGRVMIQTRNPTHPSLQCLLQKGYKGFAKEELMARENAQLPPFTYQALLRAEGRNPKAPLHFLEQVKAAFSPQSSFEILGPIPASLEKKAGFHHAQLLFQAPSRSLLQTQLKHFIGQSELLKKPRGIRWSLEMDPLDSY